MRLLLVGAGGREHALGWKLSQSRRVSELLALPGNPGLAALGPVIDGVSATDPGAVAAVARVHAVDLVVIGPEAPLAAGVADAVGRLGIPVFGPTRAAARLESSKAFAKAVMARADIPTGEAHVFDDQAAAGAHLDSQPGPYVVKADGLAAGKGVLVTEDRESAHAWLDRCFSGGFGEAGSTVVIEEYLEGPELSVFALCDGERAVTLEPARDYKRLLDGDAGPNTGGMGSYSPVDLPTELIPQVEREVIAPTLATMAEMGHPYIGFLYAGLALTTEGPKVIEFNCRLGDPETQAILPRLDTDLVDLIEACLDGRLGSTEPVWSHHAAVNVVLAAAGYPDAPRAGDEILGLESAAEDALVFHAGCRRDGARLVTSGGRVVNVVGTAKTLAGARESAYATAAKIEWPGMQYRTDIAAR